MAIDPEITAQLRAFAGGDHEALELIRERTPFPGILGYVCFHPCEDACRRGHVDQPVSICALKRFVADEEGAGEMSRPAGPETGKRVAVIGSGPAGLAASDAWSAKLPARRMPEQQAW